MEPNSPENCLTDASLSAFLGHGLGSVEADAVQTHLAGCDRCAARLSELPSLLGGSPEEVTSQTVTQAARQRAGPQVKAPEVREAPPPRALTRGASIGRYLITGQLGEGGMGVVYAAYDPDLERRVAIKVLRVAEQRATSIKEGQARLLREAQAMARVSHPNVITVHDVGVLDDRVFVAMELVEGMTMKRWLKEKQPRRRELLDTFIKAGRGLAAAHAAGMVHRDFKPENVLIGDDGRVRVTDFGLARQVATDLALRESSGFDDEVSGTLPRSDLQLTQAGVVMGTPAYMSPEQFAGAATDARSDQFSFCAALYFALWKKRPFKPAELAAHAAELDFDAPTRPVRASSSSETKRSSAFRLSRAQGVSGPISDPPRDSHIPAHIRRAVMRGLSVERGDRFQSMEALLAELSRDPAQVRRRWMVTGAACALVGSAVGVYQQVTQSRSMLCTGAGEKLAGAWDEGARAAIRSAFSATGSGFAAEAADGAIAQMDRYAGAWATMHREACEATRLRGEQTEQIMALRMTCLDRRLGDLRALGKVLADADFKTVQKAISAAQALPPVEACADVEALTSQTQLPEDPQRREEIARVGAVLSEAKALHDAGKLRPGLKIAEQAAKEAAALEYKPLLAETLHVLGWLQGTLGDPTAGEKTLHDAVFAAQAGRHDEILIRATSKLVYVDCCMLGHAEEALRWSRLADATLERIGGDELLRSELLANLGSAYAMSGKRDEAVATLERALRISAVGQDHFRRGILLSNLGTLYSDQRAYDRAVKTLEEAIGVIARTGGPEHVSVGYAHDSMAQALRGLGRHAEAHAHSDKAIALFQKALGDPHPTLAAAHETRALIFFDEGKLIDADASFRRALEMKEKALGAAHPELVSALDGLGKLLLKQKRPRDALPLLERALSLKTSDPARHASVQFGLAQALLATRGDKTRSRSLATSARETFVAAADTLEAARVDAWLQGAGL